MGQETRRAQGGNRDANGKGIGPGRVGRTRTMRGRVRVLWKFSDWLQKSRGTQFPTDPIHFGRYPSMLVDEGATSSKLAGVFVSGELGSGGWCGGCGPHYFARGGLEREKRVLLLVHPRPPAAESTQANDVSEHKFVLVLVTPVTRCRGLEKSIESAQIIDDFEYV